MIEKFFEKTYKCGVSQSTLTRVANRLISEYCYTFGIPDAPDELQEIARQIKQCVDTTEYEDESNYEYDGSGERLYDKVKYTNEARARAFWDTDEYNDPVYHVTWYFFIRKVTQSGSELKHFAADLSTKYSAKVRRQKVFTVIFAHTAHRRAALYPKVLCRTIHIRKTCGI